MLEGSPMRALSAVVLSVSLATTLGACVTARPTPPSGAPSDGLLLALSPASLGRELHLAQRVTVFRGSSTWAFDAQLEADSTEVLLAAFAMGQTVARLRWDGHALEETHSERTPDVITPARILSDVQLAFWPASAVREGLPAPFALEEKPGERLVRRDGAPFVSVRWLEQTPTSSRVELTHLTFGYRLVIESKEAP